MTSLESVGKTVLNATVDLLKKERDFKNEKELSNIALVILGIPMIYYHWLAVPLSFAAVKINPELPNQLRQKITECWHSSELGKIALCAALYATTYYDSSMPFAILYGAYLGSKLSTSPPPQPKTSSWWWPF